MRFLMTLTFLCAFSSTSDAKDVIWNGYLFKGGDGRLHTFGALVEYVTRAHDIVANFGISDIGIRRQTNSHTMSLE